MGILKHDKKVEHDGNHAKTWLSTAANAVICIVRTPDTVMCSIRRPANVIIRSICDLTPW